MKTQGPLGLFAACLATGIACLPPSVAAQQINAVPTKSNPYNTPIDRAANSPGFRCGVTVASIWNTATDAVYAAFSDDRIWYRVPRVGMQPLLYTAYSLGRKVCYQTKGHPGDDIGINVVFFDPQN